MQGAINTEEPGSTLSDKITDSYKNRVPLSEFVKIDKTSIPGSLNLFIERAKKNASRFSFYYMGILVIFNLLFLLFFRAFLIPAVITCGCAFLYLRPVTIRNFEIVPLYIVGIWLLSHFILSFFNHNIIKLYVYCFALNSFGISLVLIHGAIIDPIEEETNKV